MMKFEFWQVNYYLNARFMDLVECRKESERSALLGELSNELRRGVLTSAYKPTLRVHPFFAAFGEGRIMNVYSLRISCMMIHHLEMMT